MVEAAEAWGLEYIAITDHTQSLAMARGADEEKLRRQMAAIDAINGKIKSQGKQFTVLKGAEVNILKDGSLDIDERVLEELDVVGAAVHSAFDLSQQAQTRRLIRALENPHVDILFHLTTRLINRRKPIELDIDAIIEAAKRTGTVLEIDAYPDRLDINDEIVKKCVIAQARRGWTEKEDIINCWPLKKRLGFLKR